MTSAVTILVAFLLIVGRLAWRTFTGWTDPEQERAARAYGKEVTK